MGLGSVSRPQASLFNSQSSILNSQFASPAYAVRFEYLSVARLRIVSPHASSASA